MPRPIIAYRLWARDHFRATDNQAWPSIVEASAGLIGVSTFSGFYSPTGSTTLTANLTTRKRFYDSSTSQCTEWVTTTASPNTITVSRLQEITIDPVDSTGICGTGYYGGVTVFAKGQFTNRQGLIGSGQTSGGEVRVQVLSLDIVASSTASDRIPFG
jgi:hypothetical protein